MLQNPLSSIAKQRTRAIVLAGGIGASLLFLLPLIFSGSFQFVADRVYQYPYLAPLIIIGIRFIGVVIAPLPGSPVMLASIAVLPWWQAWLYNFLGSTAGMIAAFLIARRFREPVVARFAPLREVTRWQEAISHRNQFWAFAGLRMITPIVFDFISYAAGLTRISFWTYLLATLAVDIPTGFIFFYFGGIAMRYSIYVLIAAGGILAIAGVVAKRKYRMLTQTP